MEQTSNRKDRHVGFRLGRPYVDHLERAAAEHGLGLGQYARLILVMHFEDTTRHKIADELAELRKEVSELRLEQALNRRMAA